MGCMIFYSCLYCPIKDGDYPWFFDVFCMFIRGYLAVAGGNSRALKQRCHSRAAGDLGESGSLGWAKSEASHSFTSRPRMMMPFQLDTFLHIHIYIYVCIYVLYIYIYVYTYYIVI